MRVSEIQAGRVSLLELKPRQADCFEGEFEPEAEVRLYPTGDAHEALLEIGEARFLVAGADSRSDTELSSLVNSGLPNLCWLVGGRPRPGPASVLVVQAHAFVGRLTFPDTTRIAVSDEVVEQIRGRFLGRGRPVEDILKWLAEAALVGSPAARILVSTGNQPVDRAVRAFRIRGQQLAADVVVEADGQMRIARLSKRHRAGEAHEAIYLAEGSFEFCDDTVATRLHGLARTELDAIVRQSGSYLALWAEYNQIEKQLVLRRACDFGWIRYAACRQLPDGTWRFTLGSGEMDGPAKRMVDGLRDQYDIELEASSELPRELGGEDGPVEDVPPERPFAGFVAGFSESARSLDLRPLDPDRPESPPARGVVHVALGGDRTRLERRERARNLIGSATCGMPQLGLIVEGRPVPTARRKLERALTPEARKVFQGTPTQRQREALEIALNTPDIALIQGPPGTGKTSVIAALQVRLAEIEGATEGVSRQTLITSYQHDAVENAANRTLVLGLPAYKIGTRRGMDPGLDGVEKWRREHIEEMTRELEGRPGTPASTVLRWVQELKLAYDLGGAGDSETARMLGEIQERTADFVVPGVRDRLRSLADRLLSGRVDHLDDGREARRSLIRIVRGLRTELASFEDDGCESAYSLAKRLARSDLLTQDDRTLLERAAAWEDGVAPGFLPELKALQDRLLDGLVLPAAASRGQWHNAEVERLLTETIDALAQSVRQSASGVDTVLQEYLDDLESNPYGVRDAVLEYTSVLAATCQQSQSRRMQKLNETARFRTVIVDEAARANPLDLFIPMAQADRRIILVGDHRQLPQVLEPEVEHQIAVSGKETQEALGKSLFQRLFIRLQELYAADGIRRTVTLDTQYRMHPVLGKFVSDTFYAPFGEGFQSIRPPEDFAHGLEPYGEKPAAWVELPLAKGRELGRRSKYRPAEARWIAKEVQRLLGLRPELSLGVITFYKAQESEILRELLRLGIAEETEAGPQVAAQYREAVGADGRLTERLRVGTVDSFQGKEFDVVLLSMTRSNDLPSQDRSMWSRKYGFLMLENRLCVATSRQKRLLIVVGDAGMLSDQVTPAVRGLVEFYKLCGSPDGIRLPG